MILPQVEGRIRPPLDATTPRRAITANSRKMMMKAAQIETRSIETRARSEPVTNTLSAVVSRKAPRTDSCFHLLARYPSRKSVRAAKAKTAAAHPRLCRTASLARVRAITSGTTRTRARAR